MTEPEVLQRLEQVEKQNRRLKFAGLAGLILCAALFVMGPTRFPETITARKFVLVDEAGKVRGELDMIEGEPNLILLDANGKWRARLGVTDKGLSYLALYDASGEPRARLGVTDKGLPYLALYDASGKPRAGLTVMDTGAILALCDASGKPRASLMVAKNESNLNLWDANGNPLFNTP